MRIVHFEKGGVSGIAVDDGSGWHDLAAHESGFADTLPGPVTHALEAGHRDE